MIKPEAMSSEVLVKDACSLMSTRGLLSRALALW